MIGRNKVLLSSYSHKWSMGFRKYSPPSPKSVEWFIDRAWGKGLDGVQLSDNLSPEKWTDNRCMELGDYAGKKNIELQWGFEGWSGETVDRMIEMCNLTESKLLRGVFGQAFIENIDSRSRQKSACIDALDKVIPKLEAGKTVLAIENHFDLELDLLTEIVREYDHPLIRICLDTTNALGQIISPLKTVDMLGPYSAAIHFKDYSITKIVGGYEIIGSAVGFGDQDCYAILAKAIEYNPEMEICIELGMPPPEVEPPYVSYETDQVDRSIENTINLLKQYYKEKEHGIK